MAKPKQAENDKTMVDSMKCLKIKKIQKRTYTYKQTASKQATVKSHPGGFPSSCIMRAPRRGAGKSAPRGPAIPHKTRSLS